MGPRTRTCGRTMGRDLCRLPRQRSHAARERAHGALHRHAARAPRRLIGHDRGPATYAEGEGLMRHQLRALSHDHLVGISKAYKLPVDLHASMSDAGMVDGIV